MSLWSDSSDGLWSDFPTVTWDEIYSENTSDAVSVAATSVATPSAETSMTAAATPGNTIAATATGELALSGAVTVGYSLIVTTIANVAGSAGVTLAQTHVPAATVEPPLVGDYLWTENTQFWSTGTDVWNDGGIPQITFGTSVLDEVSPVTEESITDSVTLGASVSVSLNTVELSIAAVVVLTYSQSPAGVLDFSFSSGIVPADALDVTVSTWRIEGPLDVVWTPGTGGDTTWGGEGALPTAWDAQTEQDTTYVSGVGQVNTWTKHSSGGNTWVPEPPKDDNWS